MSLTVNLNQQVKTNFMSRKYIQFVLIAVITILFSGCKDNERLFVGGFTKPGAKGLSVYDFNPRNGDVKLISEAQVGPNPSYFCFSAKTNLFYVANEVMEFNGTFGGGLTTYKYKAEDASFEKLSEMLIPYGGPCFISLSPDSSHLLIANYPNGSVAVVKLDNFGIPTVITDTILYNKSAPDESHAHMILGDPAGKKIYVTDLGLDRIIVYDFDKNTGQLKQSENGLV
jgi:6-phosphogluconolactonase